jgi:type III secretion protein J
LLLVAACAVPVAGGLDDAEATRVVVALDRAKVDATKEPDPEGADDRWRVLVARDDVPRALETMRDEELPRAPSPGVLEALGKGGLVPSEASEHAQIVAGIAGDLERTLEGVDGVLRARVHLSVPSRAELDAPRGPCDVVAARGTASVLLAHRGSAPPLSADSVQRLVAGAVAGMLPTDVTVVLLPRPAPGAPAGDGGTVGPIAVVRASLRRLQAALVGLVGLVAVLAGATLVLYSRLAHARERAHLNAPGTQDAPRTAAKP